MRLLRGRIFAKPVYLNAYSSGHIIVGLKKEIRNVSEVVSGVDGKMVFHKNMYYHEVMYNGNKHRIIEMKDTLMYGDIDVNEKGCYVSNMNKVKINKDYLPVRVIPIKKSIITIEGENPTKYQSTRVIALYDNDDIKKGDVLIVRPVALVTYLNITGNGTPTYFYTKDGLSLFINCLDVIAKEVDGKIVPLKKYVLITKDYTFTEEYKRAKALNLEVPFAENMNTLYGNIFAGGENIGLSDGDTIIFRRNLIVPIESDIINKDLVGKIIYRVNTKDVLAKVENC